jgi:Family of unknown function (DUF6200)
MEKTTDPVVVDLGKQKKRDINDLKNGCGPLMTEVDAAVERARGKLSDGDKNRPVVPVVVIYRKKGKRRGGGSSLLSPLNPFGMFRY